MCRERLHDNATQNKKDWRLSHKTQPSHFKQPPLRLRLETRSQKPTTELGHRTHCTPPPCSHQGQADWPCSSQLRRLVQCAQFLGPKRLQPAAASFCTWYHGLQELTSWCQ